MRSTAAVSEELTPSKAPVAGVPRSRRPSYLYCLRSLTRHPPDKVGSLSLYNSTRLERSALTGTDFFAIATCVRIEIRYLGLAKFHPMASTADVL